MAKLTDAEYERIFNIYQDIKKSDTIFQPKKNINRKHKLNNMPSETIFGFLKSLNHTLAVPQETNQEYEL